MYTYMQVRLSAQPSHTCIWACAHACTQGIHTRMHTGAPVPAGAQHAFTCQAETIYMHMHVTTCTQVRLSAGAQHAVTRQAETRRRAAAAGCPANFGSETRPAN